jgi:hypothetical protein
VSGVGITSILYYGGNIEYISFQELWYRVGVAIRNILITKT